MALFKVGDILTRVPYSEGMDDIIILTVLEKVYRYKHVGLKSCGTASHCVIEVFFNRKPMAYGKIWRNLKQ